MLALSYIRGESRDAEMQMIRRSINGVQVLVYQVGGLLCGVASVSARCGRLPHVNVWRWWLCAWWRVNARKAAAAGVGEKEILGILWVADMATDPGEGAAAAAAEMCRARSRK